MKTGKFRYCYQDLIEILKQKQSYQMLFQKNIHRVVTPGRGINSNTHKLHKG